MSTKIKNPGPAYWPCPEWVTEEDEQPAIGTLMPCGCHLRRPDYEAVLCEEHLAELNKEIK